MSLEEFEGYPIISSMEVACPPTFKAPILAMAINLTNTALKSAYLRMYGSIIPILRPNTVRIVGQQDLDTYTEQVTAHVSHLAAIKYDKDKIDKSKCKDDDSNVVITMWDQPEKPIFIVKEHLDKLQTVTPKVTESNLIAAELLANELIHENIHRVPRVMDIPLFTNNGLFEDVAFSTVKAEIDDMTDPMERLINQAALNRLKNSISREKLMMRMCGALAYVYALEEEEGKMKIVADNGYDVNEALVELFSELPRRFLILEIEKNHKKSVAQQLTLSIQRAQGRVSSISLNRHSAQDVTEYGNSLGLKGNNQMLQVYHRSQIAFLHSAVLPGIAYPH